MATEIDQWKLGQLFCHPAELYELVANRRGYTPKEPVIQGDCEFVVLDIVSVGCGLCVCMVHAERRAFVMMFSHEDISAVRESLQQLQTGMGYLALSGRSPIGPFGPFLQ